MNELITIQCGPGANFVGTHMINCVYESLSYNPKMIPDADPNIMFREGVTIQGEETYTPRLLIVDTCQGLGYFPKSGGLYDDPVGDALQEAAAPVPQQLPYEKNEFIQDMEASIQGKGMLLRNDYALDNVVTAWGDFLIPRLHPRTMNIVPTLDFESDRDKPFGCFDQGLQLWGKSSFTEQFLDNLRLFVEECNNIQGFQVLSDVDNGFGGFSVRFLEYLRDDFPKKPIVAALPEGLEVRPSSTLYTNERRSLLNILYNLSGVVTNADLVLPLSVISNTWRSPEPRVYPNIRYNAELKYHTSSILGSVLECTSLCYRGREGDGVSLGDVAGMVGLPGRPVIGASICLPLPPGAEPTPLLSSASPSLLLDDLKIHTEVIVVRGFSRDSNISQPLFRKRKGMVPGAGVYVAAFKDPLRVPSTFPKIIDSSFNLRPPGPNEIGRLEEYKMASGLHNTSETGEMLNSLVSDLKKLNVLSLTQSLQSTVEEATLGQAMESIQHIADNYQELLFI